MSLKLKAALDAVAPIYKTEFLKPSQAANDDLSFLNNTKQRYINQSGEAALTNNFRLPAEYAIAVGGTAGFLDIIGNPRANDGTGAAATAVFNEADRKNRINYMIFGTEIEGSNNAYNDIFTRYNYQFDLATAQTILASRRQADLSRTTQRPQSNGFDVSNISTRVQARLQSQNFGNTGFGGFF